MTLLYLNFAVLLEFTCLKKHGLSVVRCLFRTPETPHVRRATKMPKPKQPPVPVPNMANVSRRGCRNHVSLRDSLAQWPRLPILQGNWNEGETIDLQNADS